MAGKAMIVMKVKDGEHLEARDYLLESLDHKFTKRQLTWLMEHRRDKRSQLHLAFNTKFKLDLPKLVVNQGVAQFNRR